MTTADTDLLALAIRLAEDAGPTALSMRATAVADPDTKSSPVDLVTAADKAVEQQLVQGILAVRPDDAIFGEEGADSPGTSGVRWILDPIDGTTNYVYNRADYGISIAVEVDGTIEAGVVYQPASGLLYSAAKGGGATVNGEPLAVTTPQSLAVSLIATGFGYTPERRAAQGLVLAQLLPEIRDIRRAGSAALDLCAVAAGLADAYYERGLNYWDFAAGWIVATEAGATVAGLRSDRPDESFLIAASPTIFEPLRSRLQATVVDE